MATKSKPKRIVIKFGSGILANARGTSLDVRQFRRLSAEIAELVEAGHQVVVVSSGAVAAGLAELGLTERPEDLPGKQACAAIGQSKLMQLYGRMFATHKIVVAQLLLTYRDLDSRVSHANARNTFARLFREKGIVPIVNENDSVAVEEFGKFGDNDKLSAEVAVLVDADLLILMTSVDGLLDESGKTVRVVKDVDEVAGLARHETGKFSVGGMISKLQAVKLALNAGIRTYIASGREIGRIPAIVAGKSVGTRFVAKGETL
ncbi:MAG TPA: glutamate 5-kinase [Chthoniobacter sp.]|jgi:glutamate 5-kinase